MFYSSALFANLTGQSEEFAAVVNISAAIIRDLSIVLHCVKYGVRARNGLLLAVAGAAV